MSERLKYQFLLLSFMLFGFVLTAQYSISDSSSSHCFVKENSWSLGVGAPYSVHSATLGVNGRLYYNVGHNLCFGPEFSYFKNEFQEIADVDVVVHYIFEIPFVGFFPLAGINYTSEKHNNHNKEALGVLVGGGVHRNFGKISLFGEFTHVESDLRDDFIICGLFYTFK